MGVEISAAVVSFNTRDLTLQCLQATRVAGIGRDIAFTLVDNGSTDGTVEAVRRVHPEWRIVVAPENPGYGAALNRAFKSTPGRFYLALNSDVVLHPDALRYLCDFLDRCAKCGLVGPALTYPDGHRQLSAKRFPSLAFAVGEILWFHTVFPRSPWIRRFYYMDLDPLWVDTVSGSAMLIRGDAFERVGGFDEGFRMYFEETDFCLRLQRAGFSGALCPQAKAVHWHGASTIQTSTRQVEYYLSYIRFFRKHHGRAASLMLTAVVALSTVIRMAGLALKYPPFFYRQDAILRSKLAACLRLLESLARSVNGAPSTEIRR